MNIRLWIKIKKIIVIIFIFSFLSNALAKEGDKFDISIEKSLEIFGTEEKPKIIFVLPEYNLEFKVFKTDKRYLLRFDEMLRKDLFDK
jgi:hypothetical protein